MLAAEIITDLQTHGIRLLNPGVGAHSRRGGAGPTDHKALTIDGLTVMIPVHTATAFESPYVVDAPDKKGTARVFKNGEFISEIYFPKKARFLDLSTADGVPYGQIAQLHSKDVLATTVLQTCIRYKSRQKTCKFCAIGQSLAIMHGCTLFLAHVQLRNVPLFKKLNWYEVESLKIHGQTHMKMKANLTAFSSVSNPKRGWITSTKKRAA